MQCCVPFCKSTAEVVSESTGITFHEFPREVHLRSAWLKALGTQDNLPDSAVVCSQHFLNDDIYETKSGSRQIRSGAIPSTVQVCMICFDIRSKLYPMSKYKLDEAYQHLVGHPLCDLGNVNQTLCVQCAQRLVNFNKFRDKSLRARSLMLELVQKHELITIKHTDIFNEMNTQMKHNIVLTALKPDHCDLYINTDKQTDVLSNVKPVVKSEVSEVSHESMLVDEDVTEHSVVVRNKNTENSLNINLVVTKEEYVSDEELKQTTDPLFVKPSTSKDEDDVPLAQIKYEITFECSVCCEEFADEESYNYHMSAHTEENQNLAEDNAECGQPSVDPLQRGLVTKLHAVAEIITDGPVFKQQNVSDKTVSESEACHLVEIQDCNVEYESITIIPDKIETSIQVLSCKFCAYKTLRKDYLENHMLTHIFTCKLCGNQFSRKGALVKHLKTHTGVKPFSCNLCEYKSTFKKGLVVHMKIHSGEKPFSCEFCEIKFARKSDLTRHTKIHTSEKSFSCEQCDYKSTRGGDVTKHMVVHTGEKPFSCEVCDVKFARKGDLVKHTRTHTGEKLFACDYCEYKCPRKKTLVNHIRTHTGEKPHCCKICSYKCINKQYLMRHMKTHTGKQPFSCEYCEHKFARYKYLAGHLKIIHKVKNYTVPSTSKNKKFGLLKNQIN